MSSKKPDARRRLMMLAVSMCTLMCVVPGLTRNAAAQNATDDTAASARKPGGKSDAKRNGVTQAKPSSPNATINLVNMLVEQGVLKEDQAAALIKQADDEAYVQRQAAKDAAAKAEIAAKAADAATAVAQPAGTKHVTYVPEIVKKQLREEIKQEVMATAQRDNWASPGKYPEWADRIHFYGDFRARYQGDFFPHGNDQADAINYNAINTGSPYDINSGLNWPTYNASQDREQAELRARLGVNVDLFNGFTAGMRIATGNSSSPVSTNQTLGASTSGGDFSKYALWLDRGFLKYQSFNNDVALSIGRFDNPFWSATDLVWYNELAFDGFAVQARHEVAPGLTPFAVAGAFPIFNSDLNVGTNLLSLDPSGNLTAAKFPSHDEWLFGGQVGFEERFKPESSFRFAVAYYDFDNVQGQVSSPCSILTSTDVCDTDQTRTLFSQKGNTEMPLRNIIADASFTAGTQPEYQFFGLVSQYRPIVASAQLDFGDFNPVHIVLDGEFVWNSAFDRNLMNNPAMPIFNNFGPGGTYNGGDQGWYGRLTVGNKEIKRLGDWNVSAGYKYLESDATLDAFVDPDFGLGGTNLKGYIIGGNYGLSDNVWATMKWMSANNIGGVPYAVDVLQLDLNARF
jgi:hypothetical protein